MYVLVERKRFMTVMIMLVIKKLDALLNENSSLPGKQLPKGSFFLMYQLKLMNNYFKCKRNFNPSLQ